MSNQQVSLEIFVANFLRDRGYVNALTEFIKEAGVVGSGFLNFRNPTLYLIT